MSYRNNMDEADAVIRFDLVYTILSVCGAILIGWAISLIPESHEMKTLVWLLSSGSSAIYLLLYANAGNKRSATVIKYTSWATLFISNLLLLGMSIWCHNSTYFILVTCAIVLFFIATVYSVAKANQ